MKKNNIKIVVVGFLCVFLSSKLFANPDSLIYPKKKNTEVRPLFWLAKWSFLCPWIRLGAAKKNPRRPRSFKYNSRSSWFQRIVLLFSLESYFGLRHRFLEPHWQFWPHIRAQRRGAYRFKTVAFWSLPKCRHQSLAIACANGHVCARSVLCFRQYHLQFKYFFYLRSLFGGEA